MAASASGCPKATTPFLRSGPTPRRRPPDHVHRRAEVRRTSPERHAAIERNQIDLFEQPDHLPHPERDFFAAQRLREIALESEPHLVYVNKWGAHFPFARNYPRESAVFVPDMEGREAIGASRERLLNSYKNAIR